MKKLKPVAVLCFVSLLLCSSIARADSFTFETLSSDGLIEGVAGSTIGWGYTLANSSSSLWLVLTGLSADVFLNATPNVLFDFPILSPGSSVSVAYDPLNGFGLYELAWDSTAPEGSLNTGTFLLTGEFWNGDPFAGGSFVDFAPDATAAYSATVAAAPPVSLPAPGTLLLLASGLGVLYLKRRTGTPPKRTAATSVLGTPGTQCEMDSDIAVVLRSE